MDLGIAGRRAAVAAGSAGLGLASARALVAAGARVAICGRDRSRLERALASLSGGEGEPVGIEADLSTVGGAEGFLADATDALGGIDILVPNAGGPPPGTFASTDIAAYGPALELNLLDGGHVQGGRAAHAIPGLGPGGGDHVHFRPSAHRRVDLSNTARAGVTGFLKTLALEVAGDGVTVNTVQPGSHATDRMNSLHGGDLTAVARATPTGTVGRAEDFGAVVALLCSAHARFITGASLPVDGGAHKGLQ
ncbi:MAG: SDR family oxidoreductase [Acidimicrobiales bacterium]